MLMLWRQTCPSPKKEVRKASTNNSHNAKAMANKCPPTNMRQSTHIDPTKASHITLYKMMTHIAPWGSILSIVIETGIDFDDATHMIDLQCDGCRRRHLQAEALSARLSMCKKDARAAERSREGGDMRENEPADCATDTLR